MNLARTAASALARGFHSNRPNTRIGISAIVTHDVVRAGEIAETLNEDEKSWMGENGRLDIFQTVMSESFIVSTNS